MGRLHHEEQVGGGWTSAPQHSLEWQSQWMGGRVPCTRCALHVHSDWAVLSVGVANASNCINSILMLDALCYPLYDGLIPFL